MARGSGADDMASDEGSAAGGRPPEAVVKATATKSPLVASELLRADAGNVQAETVSLERSGAESIVAERAIVSNSGARSIEARSAQLDKSGVLALQAERVVLQDSSALAVIADEVRLVGTKALFVKGATVSADGASRTVVGAGSDKAVRPLVSSAGAAAFGAALALLLLGLGRLLGRGRGSR